MNAVRGRLAHRAAERRRRRALAARHEGALAAYLAEPVPDPATPHTRARLLALDLETTGLDAEHDHVVSVGMVPVDGDRVLLGGARHVVVRAPAVGDSAALHGITDDTASAGVPLDEALDAVLDALRGRVLLAHHARLELAFLGAACRRLHGVDLPVLVVDTLTLAERTARSAWDDEPAPGSLRLQAARDRHGLPRYRSHHALTDALACAELYLAQVSEIAGGGPVPLHRLLAT